MNSQVLDGKNEKGRLISNAGEKYSKAAAASGQGQTISAIRNRINEEAEKIKSNLITTISKKRIPTNSLTKDRPMENPSLKSNIVRSELILTLRRIIS